MGVVVDNLDRVKRLTADGTVLAVAHTGKGDNDTRGFSSIEDDADIVWSVKREGDLKEVRLTCVKMKDDPDGHKIDLRLRAEGESLVVERGNPTIGEMLSGSGVPESDEKIMAVMHELFADMGATVTDLTWGHRIVEEHGLSLAQETHRRWTATYGEKVRAVVPGTSRGVRGYARKTADRTSGEKLG
jgi:hypothetical protein